MDELALKLIGKLNEVIITPLIILFTTGALIMFFYGFTIFILHSNENEKREAGKRHMIYGVFGLFIIFSVYGILNFFGATIESIS